MKTPGLMLALVLLLAGCGGDERPDETVPPLQAPANDATEQVKADLETYSDAQRFWFEEFGSYSDATNLVTSRAGVTFTLLEHGPNGFAVEAVHPVEGVRCVMNRTDQDVGGVAAGELRCFD